MGKAATASLAALVGGACRNSGVFRADGGTTADESECKRRSRGRIERVCVLANDGRTLVVRGMRRRSRHVATAKEQKLTVHRVV